MSSTKRVVESKKGHRSTSAAPNRNFQCSTKNRTQSNTNIKPLEQPLRSVGPVTRSLTNAFRSAFSTTTSLTDKKKLVQPTTRKPWTISKSNTKSSESNSTNNLKNVAIKSNNNKVTKTKNNETVESKDSVFSEEVDGDVTWVNATQYISKFDKQIRNKDPSYLRISKVLSGYVTRRSLTPDLKNNLNFNFINQKTNYFDEKKKDLLKSSSQTLINGSYRSSSDISDNGFCEEKNDLESCSSYSFVVPQFKQSLNNGQAYKILLNDILMILNSHISKCQFFLENETLISNSIAEAIRVAVGRTQLLLKKRLIQFDTQLKRHMNPVIGEKETTLNDLHGLWSLIDIQLDDIRQCFKKVEESRINNWEEIPESKPLLTTAASMPSLRLNSKTSILKPNLKSKLESNTKSNKCLNEKSQTNELIDKRTALEEKRRKEARCRMEFIKAKRLEMNKMQENDHKNNKNLSINTVL